METLYVWANVEVKKGNDLEEIYPETKIPLVRLPNGTYDIIASLKKKFPNLEAKYPFDTISERNYTYNYATKKKQGYDWDVKSFGSDSPLNRKTLAQIEQQQDKYVGEKYNNSLSVRMTYIINLRARGGATVGGGGDRSGRSTVIFSCAKCSKVATLVDTRANLAYCSYDCIQ